MKAIRITLFVLIIIGFLALATQKLWVPKLVAHIISSDATPAVVQVSQPSQTVQPTIVLKDGRQCYTYSHETTTSEPYATTEFIDMTIHGNSVTGTKRGTQTGPDMTNGYTGKIVGTKTNDTIDALFSYTIEGSQNIEKELYRTTTTGIEKLRYPLIDQNDILVPDTTKAFSTLEYARVGCTASK